LPAVCKKPLSYLGLKYTIVERVKETVKIYDPICELINACQDSKCSAADAVELCLNIELPSKYHRQLKDRKKWR
jgi:hypothetical protein